MIKDNNSPMDFFGGAQNLGDNSDIQIMDTMPVEEENNNNEAIEEEKVNSKKNFARDTLSEDQDFNDEGQNDDIQDDEDQEDETPLEREGSKAIKDEEDLDGFTQAGILAKSFVEDGVLPKDFKYDKDLTGADLKKALRDEAISDLDPATYFKSLGYNDKVIEMSTNIVNGVDPSMAFEANRYEAIAEADVENNPDYARSILSLDYAERGMKETEIEDLIDIKIEKGEEIEDAKKAQQRFAAKAKDIRSKEQSRIKEQEQNRERLKNQVIDIITKENLGSNLNEKSRKDLIDYVYKPTETVEQKVGEKTIKNFVSKFKKDFDNIFADPLEFAKFAHNLQNGWDAGEKKKSDKVDTAVSTIDALNRRVNNKLNKKDTSKVKNIFTNMQMLSAT